MAFGNIGAVGTLPVPFGGTDGVRLFGTSMVASVARRTGDFVIGYPGTFFGIALVARIGAFDPTAAAGDSGVFSSADPVGTNFHGLPRNFGPGRGRWTPTDLMRLSIDIYDPGDGAAPSPNIHVSLMRVQNLADANNSFQVDFDPGLGITTLDNGAIPRFGDLLIGLHNRGGADSGAEPNAGFSVRIAYDHSLPTGV